MPNGTAKFVSALFASFLASAPVLATPDNTAPAVDDCLTGPKGQTPAGSHWYYRIDHGTGRHCWYLGDEREKLSQTAAPNAPSPKPMAPKAETPMQSSIANAHAELAPQTRIEEPASVATPAPAVTVDAMAATPSLLSQRSIVATRWPQSSGLTASADPAPPAVNLAAAEPPATQATPPAVAAVPPAPAMNAVTLAAADAPSELQSRSIQMLLVVILGALPLAGVMASVIFRFGSTRRASRRDLRSNRREIRGSIDGDHAPPWASPHIRLRRTVGHAQEAADDPSARIEKMLAQLSRNAQA